MSLVIGGIGAGLAAVGTIALYRQSRATTCPKHNRWAGRIGVALAWLSQIAGVCLLVGAVSLYRTDSSGSQNGEPEMKPLWTRLGDWIDSWTGRIRATVRKPSLSTAEAEKVVDRLVRMGYLKFVPETQHADVRLQLVETATKSYLDSEWNDDCVAADLRSYPADNEDLAEGQVGATILLMRPALEKEYVKLDSVVDDFGRDEYAVVINGQRHLIYESQAVASTNIWSIALRRFMEIVNGLLEQAGSAERLYGLYGGNDGRVILLTPEMRDYIESLGDVFDSGWMPYPESQVETPQG